MKEAGQGGCQLTARESIKAVDGSEVLEIVLLGQDEDDRVVSVAAARVDLNAGTTTVTTISE